MLTVRVLPREGVTLRAAAATVEVTAVLALGHVVAGGSLPSVPWLLVMAAAVLGAGLSVLHGRVRPAVAVPVLVAAQLLLHAWSTALAPVPEAHAGHVGHVEATFEPAMVAVHVAGGLVTALLWELRARAGEVVVTWVRQPLPPLPARRLVASPRVEPLALTSRSLVSAAPRRGPPALAVAA